VYFSLILAFLRVNFHSMVVGCGWCAAGSMRRLGCKLFDAADSSIAAAPSTELPRFDLGLIEPASGVPEFGGRW
jgi:hypothetical protein